MWVIWLGGLSLAHGQEAPAILRQADSLFAQGQYGPAMQQYAKVFEENQQYTPAMLLKLALLHERNQEYSYTLYYLNAYFLKTGDRAALTKASDLAEQYELEGYERSDWAYFRSLAYRWLPQIQGALMALLALWLILMVYVKLVRKQKLRALPLGTMVFGGLLALVLNMSFYHTVIIAQDQTIMRENPSAAAEVVNVWSKGHRLSLLDREDVWWKVRDNQGNTGYVRAAQVLAVQDQPQSY